MYIYFQYSLLVERALSRARLLKCNRFFFRSEFVGPAFLAKTVETGDKNRDDFHCMEMSLVMSNVVYFGGDDGNVNAQCLSRLSAFLPCKKSEFIFFVKTGYVSCLYDIVIKPIKS